MNGHATFRDAEHIILPVAPAANPVKSVSCKNEKQQCNDHHICHRVHIALDLNQ